MRAVLALAGFAVAFAAGFAVAREFGAGDDEAAAPRDASPMPTRLGDPLPDAGSMFRARFASVDASAGKEGLLLTPRKEDAECRDTCPLGVRVHGGEKGWKEELAVLGSLRTRLRALIDASRTPDPEFSAALSRFLSTYATVSAHREEPRAAVPRMLFLAAPRPEFGPHEFGVAWAAYTHADPHFDADADVAARPASGMRLSVSRIDDRRDPDGDRFTTTAGDVCVVDVAPGSPDPRADGPGAEVLVVRGPLPGHFKGAAGRAVGLLVERDGTIAAYGPDLVPRRLQAGADLRGALLALIERP